MSLEIDEKRQGEGEIELSLGGVLNIRTAMELRRRLQPLLNSGNREIHVNLARVDFIDSAGLATLVEGLQWSRAKEGRRFVLSGLSENVRDIFELARLDSVFEIADGAKD